MYIHKVAEFIPPCEIRAVLLNNDESDRIKMLLDLVW